MMRRKPYAIALIVAAAALLALGGCAGNNAGNRAGATNAPSPGTTASASAPAGGRTVDITVQAKNFLFEPADIPLRVGDTVNLTLNNTNGVHGLAIPDLGVNVKNGETATFVVDKPGKYDFVCSIQCGTGHDNMTGTLTVS